MKHYIIIFYCILLLPTLGYSQGTRTLEELIFKAPDSDNETCYITIEAVNGLTRWALNGSEALPTTGCRKFSGEFEGGSGDYYGLHSPDDGADLAWGKYYISFSCTDNFYRQFYLDLRDKNWSTNYGIGCPDVVITYYPENTPSEKLEAEISGRNSEYITQLETVDVWYLGDVDQNQTDLLVPVTADNNWDGGNIEMASHTYSAPHTENWGWTFTHSIEAISPQTVDDIIYTFSEWSDEVATNPRDVTPDDSHSSYSFTANFASKPVTPDNFSGTTYNNHPKLSWDALTGSSILGYKMYRDYNKGGWQYVTSVTPKSEDDWVDNDITTSGSPTYITKYRITSYTSGAESDYTSTYTTYGRYTPRKSGGNKNVQIPEEPVVSYNYPNPFNPETIICYQISQDSHVSLTIYNLLGEEVRRLVNEKQSPGKYNIRWNGCDSYGNKLVGGIYIYRIIAVTTSGDAPSRFVETRKMIMMK